MSEKNKQKNKKNEPEINKPINFKKVKWKGCFAFEAFGVKIGVRSNNIKIIEKLKDGLPFLLPIDLKEIQIEAAEHIYSVYRSKSRRRPNLTYLGQEEVVRQAFNERKVDLIESQIRMTVAEFAEDFVFLHAGAIGYKGKAIIIPARSFSGKTSLVAEFAKRGFEYYSDEYAVLDRNGLVHPFTKKLSIRGIIDDYQQVDIGVEELGGRKGVVPLEVGLILVSRYVKGGKFTPELVSAGAGIIESIANSVSIRQNPQFVLQVLSLVTNRAKIVKTNRSEAKKFVDRFLVYLEEIGY